MGASRYSWVYKWQLLLALRPNGKITFASSTATVSRISLDCTQSRIKFTAIPTVILQRHRWERPTALLHFVLEQGSHSGALLAISRYANDILCTWYHGLNETLQEHQIATKTSLRDAWVCMHRSHKRDSISSTAAKAETRASFFGMTANGKFEPGILISTSREKSAPRTHVSIPARPCER